MNSLDTGLFLFLNWDGEHLDPAHWAVPEKVEQEVKQFNPLQVWAFPGSTS